MARFAIPLWRDNVQDVGEVLNGGVVPDVPLDGSHWYVWDTDHEVPAEIIDQRSTESPALRADRTVFLQPIYKLRD